jgi:pimeloyl-ACP methyl ester carboxylesterase
MQTRLFFFVAIFTCFFNSNQLSAQKITYPYPVKSYNVNIEGHAYPMSYMDVQPSSSNGQNVILFHGKNFSGLYWKDVIKSLSAKGYRVVAPDQVGWGKSAKPSVKYTFEMLARNTKLLLDHLQIEKVIVIGHSMGGMLATRFALQYPDITTKLILEDPLGLEDYKKFIPYRSMDEVYKKELTATYSSYKKYQISYYPDWKPQYELYVKAQAAPLKNKDFPAVAWVNALTYQMIYEQPVLYEFEKLTMPVLFIVGELDRTILGKDKLGKAEQRLHGNLPILAKMISKRVQNSKVIILPGVGHIPHVQVPEVFMKKILEFL